MLVSHLWLPCWLLRLFEAFIYNTEGRELEKGVLLVLGYSNWHQRACHLWRRASVSVWGSSWDKKKTGHKINFLAWYIGGFQPMCVIISSLEFTP